MYSPSFGFLFDLLVGFIRLSLWDWLSRLFVTDYWSSCTWRISRTLTVWLPHSVLFRRGGRIWPVIPTLCFCMRGPPMVIVVLRLVRMGLACTGTSIRFVSLPEVYGLTRLLWLGLSYSLGIFMYYWMLVEVLRLSLKKQSAGKSL